MARNKDIHIELVDAGDGQGKIQYEVNRSTGQRKRVGYVPNVNSQADKLTWEVIQSGASTIGAYVSAGLAALDVVATQGAQLVANVASNPDIAHIAQRLGDAEPGALGALAALTGVGVEEVVRHNRRARKLAQELGDQQDSPNPLPALVEARAAATTTKWTVRAGTLAVPIPGANLAATVTAYGAIGAETTEAVQQRKRTNKDLYRRRITRH